jgi:hypothetical protein
MSLNISITNTFSGRHAKADGESMLYPPPLYSHQEEEYFFAPQLLVSSCPLGQVLQVHLAGCARAECTAR